jgi:hypothetical protein
MTATEEYDVLHRKHTFCIMLPIISSQFRHACDFQRKHLFFFPENDPLLSREAGRGADQCHVAW